MNDGAGDVDHLLNPLGDFAADEAQPFPLAVRQNLADPGQPDRHHAVHLADDIVERLLIAERHMLIGLDRQFLVAEMAVAEMILIALGRPGFGILETFRHIRNQLEQHHDLVEMVEIVGCQQGEGVDIRPPRTRAERLIGASLPRRHMSAFRRHQRVLNRLTSRINGKLRLVQSG